MKTRFMVIHVSDRALLASYAKYVRNDGEFEIWEFDPACFEEWANYAMCSDEVSGVVYWPDGSRSMIAISGINEEEV
jgi:hypothetical protein